MPELPEVETVLRTLETRLQDRRIEEIEILYAPIVTGDSAEFITRLKGQHFRHFKRRGKYLLFEMDSLTLVSHLRMEGKYFLLEENDPVDKHTHVIFHLDDGTSMRYHDVRKFGRMELIEQGDYLHFRNLGPEPFSSDFNSEYIKKYLKGLNAPIKEVLLRQEFVAGIGNIYADEILFECRIKPTRKACRISRKEAEMIVKATHKILSDAIKAGGTTIRSYTSSLGVSGRFQLSLNVHTMKECPVCQNLIKKIRVGGRGTYYCSLCQK